MNPRKDNLYQRTGIYGIKNTVNGKVYVGQTNYNFGDRRDCHFSLLRNGKHPVKQMQEDFNSVGESNFVFLVLHDLQDGELLDELERSYISKYKSKQLAYNAVNGGRKGFSQVPYSSETRKHIGELNRIRLTGSKLSEERKKHMSESHKRRFQSMTEEEKDVVRNQVRELGKSHKDKKWTEEQRQAMRDEQKTKPRGAKYTADQVKKMRQLYEHEKLSIREIADMIGASPQAVYLIVTYRRWKNLV